MLALNIPSAKKPKKNRVAEIHLITHLQHSGLDMKTRLSLFLMKMLLVLMTAYMWMNVLYC